MRNETIRSSEHRLTNVDIWCSQIDRGAMQVLEEMLGEDTAEENGRGACH